MKMNEIDKKLSEIDFSDLGLKGHGSELDRDDFDNEFKEFKSIEDKFFTRVAILLYFKSQKLR